MDAGFQYILFPLFLTPSILFTEKNKRIRLSLMTIIMIIYLGLEFFQYKSINTINLFIENAQISRLILLIDAFILFYVLIHFKLQMIHQIKLNLHHYLKIYKLTQPESEIVIEICNGLNNKKIAKALFIEEGTVKTHLNSIYKKLNVKSRSELLSQTYRTT